MGGRGSKGGMGGGGTKSQSSTSNVYKGMPQASYVGTYSVPGRWADPDLYSTIKDVIKNAPFDETSQGPWNAQYLGVEFERLVMNYDTAEIYPQRMKERVGIMQDNKGVWRVVDAPNPDTGVENKKFNTRAEAEKAARSNLQSIMKYYFHSDGKPMGKRTPRDAPFKPEEHNMSGNSWKFDPVNRKWVETASRSAESYRSRAVN